ncbi:MULTISPECIES: hypothetical protein [Gammaproteobacteria]|uniref:hypothetical protein n=1 Tax=Gammaproteobacteria TaxID=1236 RepID=UPI000DD0CE8C|nr:MULTISPECIES: hypothetical protein [Gammaproteobacteria]RTE86879.1 hypothetical protein DQX04_00345 [Aliidiomarina sp. B3213]TCZ93332.1 hypothetical protein EYQ95_04955 [Lysobacter sp. N42]
MTLTLMETVIVIALASGVAASFALYHASPNLALDDIGKKASECVFSSQVQQRVLEEQWVFNETVTETSVNCHESN